MFCFGMLDVVDWGCLTKIDKSVNILDLVNLDWPDILEVVGPFGPNDE